MEQLVLIAVASMHAWTYSIRHRSLVIFPLMKLKTMTTQGTPHRPSRMDHDAGALAGQLPAARSRMATVERQGVAAAAQLAGGLIAAAEAHQASTPGCVLGKLHSTNVHEEEEGGTCTRRTLHAC